MRRWLVAALAAACVACAHGASPVPSFESVRAEHQPSDVLLLDRDGRPIGSRRIDPAVRRLAWVGLEETSPALVEALLAAEDRRFFEHAGVDWRAALSALWEKTAGQGGRGGASTLSMQVAAMLDPALARGSAPRNWSAKWDQAEAAFALERAWTKEQILEAYLNRVSFRGELQGLRAASQGLFGKLPSGLDRQDSALLAALVRAPSASPAVVARRACQILAVTRGPQAACERTELAALLQHASLDARPVEPLAPHAARRLLASGTTLHSSLDAGLQQAVRDALQEQIASLSGHGVEDGAAVVLDNRTGQVLAYVGSSGSYSRAAQVDAAAAPRQAGSTLKPFLYGLALQRQLVTAATLIDDSPIAVSTDAGLYAPRNYDLRYLGPVSVRQALGSSLNVPAVRLIGLTGAPAFHGLLRQAGLATLEADPEPYGDSLALGTADVTLLDLTNAYRTLANGGQAGAVRWTLDTASVPRRRVLSPPVAWLVGHILSDNAARASTFGFDSVLATPFWTAVKTGTSKDMRDNWCVGFSAHYTVGVWVGNAGGAPMRDVSGVSGAAPAWAQIMRHLHRALASPPPAAPAGVSARTIAFAGQEPGRVEWFLAGTEPLVEPGGTAPIPMQGATAQTRILSPAPGALVAWDPDIPSAQQGIVARHGDARHDLQWVLNGEPVGAGRRVVLPLRPGANVLALRTAQGEPLEELRYEVRGMPSPSDSRVP